MSSIFKTVDSAKALDLTVRLGDCLPPEQLPACSGGLWCAPAQVGEVVKGGVQSQGQRLGS